MPSSSRKSARRVRRGRPRREHRRRRCAHSRRGARSARARPRPFAVCCPSDFPTSTRPFRSLCRRCVSSLAFSRVSRSSSCWSGCATRQARASTGRFVLPSASQLVYFLFSSLILTRRAQPAARTSGPAHPRGPTPRL
eukprot:scaffold49732_cov62-Phaeocystis_antarctica.AAC.1